MLVGKLAMRLLHINYTVTSRLHIPHTGHYLNDAFTEACGAALGEGKAAILTRVAVKQRQRMWAKASEHASVQRAHGIIVGGALNHDVIRVGLLSKSPSQQMVVWAQIQKHFHVVRLKNLCLPDAELGAAGELPCELC